MHFTHIGYNLPLQTKVQYAYNYYANVYSLTLTFSAKCKINYVAKFTNIRVRP